MGGRLPSPMPPKQNSARDAGAVAVGRLARLTDASNTNSMPATSARPTSPRDRPTDVVRMWAVVLLGVLLRIGAYALAPMRARSLLEDRTELVSPSTSIRGLREAVHLAASPSLIENTPGTWHSPHVHHPPLVVRLLAPLVSSASIQFKLNLGQWCVEARKPTLFELLFIVADCCTALALVRMERLRAPFRPLAQVCGLAELEASFNEKANQARRKSGRISLGPASRVGASAGTTSRSALVAALYLLNPITFLTGLALSTTTLYAPIMAWTIYFALASADKGAPASRPSHFLKCVATAGLLAINVTVAMYPLLLLPPVCMLATTSRPSAISLSLLAVAFSLALGWCNLFLLSGAGVHGWDEASQVWRACYGHLVLLTDLAPNAGIWWYFFTEMFDHFRSFFLLTFNAHLALYVTPLCIKFRSDPFFVLTLLIGILAVFKPYPTLGDSALYWCFLALHPEILPCMSWHLPLLFLILTLRRSSLSHCHCSAVCLRSRLPPCIPRAVDCRWVRQRQLFLRLDTRASSRRCGWIA